MRRGLPAAGHQNKRSSAKAGALGAIAPLSRRRKLTGHRIPASSVRRQPVNSNGFSRGPMGSPRSFAEQPWYERAVTEAKRVQEIVIRSEDRPVELIVRHFAVGGEPAKTVRVRMMGGGLPTDKLVARVTRTEGTVFSA
jgi:hypothetical protein